MNAPPKEDPQKIELRTAPRPVKRLNRRTLGVLAGITIGVIASAIFWTFRAPSKALLAQPDTPTAERVTRAEGLARLPKDYASLPKPPQLGPPLGELGGPILGAERGTGSFRPDPEEDAARAERLRVQAEANEARKAQVFYQLRQRPDLSRGMKPSQGSDTDANRDASPPIDSERRGPGANGGDEKVSFASGRADSEIYASGQLQEPRSPYQLMAGTVIPAALWTAINSDLPGQIIAEVTENVYDTVSGQTLLVPQGSRLLGQYDSQVAFGQRRVLLVWTRLVMPDGSSVVLDRIPGVDTEGQAGLEDRVNWHWSRIFSGAAVSTLIGAGAELARPDRGLGNGTTVVVASRESLQQSINEVGQEITRRNLDIQPTLSVRAGFPVRAIVNKDLVLAPYGDGADRH